MKQASKRSIIFRTILAMFFAGVIFSSANAQQRYKISSIQITGTEHLSSADILRLFSSKSGDTLYEKILEDDIDKALAQYEEIGYPLAKITIERITQHDPTSVDIILRIDEGKHPRLTEVKIIGNNITDSSIITREFFLNEKPYFDKNAIQSSRNRIEHLGIFSEVSPAEIFAVNDSSVGITISVSETRSTYIDGILGYNPPPVKTQSGFLSGFVSLGFTNIAGTARNASLDFRKETQDAQELSVRYGEPWLFGLPVNMNIAFLQRDEDSIYTRTNLIAEPSLLLSNGFSLSASLAYDRIVPGSAKIVYDSRALIVGVGGKLDTRDNIAAPRKGFILSLGASYGSKSIESATSFDSLASRSLALRTLSFEGAFAVTTFTDRLIFVPSVSARMADISGGELDESDLFRIGGLRTLRGYFESQFHISRFVILHADYRFMTGRTSYLGIFADYGYLERPLSATFAAMTIYPLGYGVSFQFDTQLGLLSASIGLAKNETVDKAKLHFGIIKDF